MISLPPWVPSGLEINRADFDVEDFRRALLQEGRRLWWEGANDCPCRQQRTMGGKTEVVEEPRTDCPGCKGSGIVYGSGQQTIGMLQGVREEQRRYNQFGPNATGYANLTLLPENLPAFNDRFTLIDGARVFSEIRQHLETVERLRYPVITRTVMTGTGPKLNTRTAVSINVLHARGTDATGVLQPTVYTRGTHFEVVNGSIDWTIGEDEDIAPPVGSHVSFRYLCRPVFIVLDHAYVTRDLFNRNVGELELGQHPVNVLVMMEHLGIRNPPVANFNPSATFGPVG